MADGASTGGWLFVVKEYATGTLEEAESVFRGEPALHRAWGMLFCDGRDGKHWTLLGDRDWVVALEARAQPMSAEEIAAMPPSPLGGEPAGLEVVGPVGSYEGFRPEWVVRGWPDEWPELGSVSAHRWAEVTAAFQASTPPCPKCGARDAAQIVYGLPTDEAFEEARLDRVHLGGCIIEENSPDTHCRKCGYEWSARDSASNGASELPRP